MTRGVAAERLACITRPPTAGRGVRDEGSRTMVMEHDRTDREHGAVVA
jgi:hypothetical protein